MLKGAYIIYDNIHENQTGVNKKILAQIESFRQSGFEILEINQFFSSNFLIKLMYRLPGLSPKWLYVKELESCDFVYLRRPPFMSGKFVSFLKEVKQHGTKVILEIPTYPYDAELSKQLKLYPFYIKDKIYRMKLKRYVDRIVTLTDDKKIFGIDTLHINNGYDFSQMLLRKIEVNDTIDLCCVALFQPWHGYERLIEGLQQYKISGGDRKILLHFVGDGSELTKYKKMVKKYNLEDYTIFYGMRSSSELLEIYNRFDIGVLSLGAYKKNLLYSQELKSREYIAVGLPMIVGCKTDFLEYPELSNFILKYPNDDTYIDFEKIVNWYDSLYNDVEDVQKWSLSIREFGINHLGMEKAMQEVIDFLHKEIC